MITEICLSLETDSAKILAIYENRLKARIWIVLYKMLCHISENLSFSFKYC